AKPAPKALHKPEDAYNLVMPLIDDPNREHFVVIVLDVRNRPRGIARVGTGAVDHCLVDPREVFAPAIRLSGTAVLLVHNHPSGDPTPSIEDIELTQRLAHAGDLISMPILDHLIIGTGPHVNEARKFVSLAEVGHMRAGRIQTEGDTKDDATLAKKSLNQHRRHEAGGHTKTRKKTTRIISSKSR
ncbi:MAG: JAB domain-containing protein, partial [Clostridia bacterium]|nr:JAB domain-containing protein [Deltaproteobacteria bacterium]